MINYTDGDLRNLILVGVHLKETSENIPLRLSVMSGERVC